MLNEFYWCSCDNKSGTYKRMGKGQAMATGIQLYSKITPRSRHTSSKTKHLTRHNKFYIITLGPTASVPISQHLARPGKTIRKSRPGCIFLFCQCVWMVHIIYAFHLLDTQVQVSHARSQIVSLFTK